MPSPPSTAAVTGRVDIETAAALNLITAMQGTTLSRVVGGILTWAVRDLSPAHAR